MIFLPQLHTIHLWQINLSSFFLEYEKLFSLLNPEEQSRALRFRFDIHRKRFVVGRAILRKILSEYTKTSAEKIIFAETAHAKPYLKKNSHLIDFNLSHSEDLMICAIGYQMVIGIDIEKLQIDYDMRVAERFFSVSENTLLHLLSEPQKKQTFFQLWTGKEAIVKMTGKGLWTAISSFSIDPEKNYQTILLDKKNRKCHLRFLNFYPDYACSLATTREIQHIENFTWKKNGMLALEKSSAPFAVPL